MTQSSQPTQDIINDFVGSAHGSVARVKDLLAQHPSLLNARAVWDESAIEAASQVGSVETADFLLAAGAPTSVCTEAMLGHFDKVKAYLDADPSQANAKGAHGISVLYHAVIRGHKDVAELLLSRGADVNAGEGGSPPIHGAVTFNRADMVEWLLALGANVNAKNHEGKTPLKAAMEGDKAELGELLKRHGGVE